MDKSQGLKGLAQIRSALGLTNEQIAERCGTTPQFISRLANSRQDCSMALARRMADSLGVKVAELTDGLSDERFLEIRRDHLKRDLASVENALIRD